MNKRASQRHCPHGGEAQTQGRDGATRSANYLRKDRFGQVAVDPDYPGNEKHVHVRQWMRGDTGADQDGYGGGLPLRAGTRRIGKGKGYQ